MQIKLVAAGLFSAGVLVGWAVTGDYYEKKMKSNHRLMLDIVKNQSNLLNDLREEFATTPDIPLVDRVPLMDRTPFKATVIEDEDVTEETDEEADDDDYEVPEGETPEETRANLQKLIDKYVPDDDEVVEEFVSKAETALKQGNTPPFVIPRAKFAWDEEEGDQYEKVTLTYFPRERILLDEDGDIISDVNSHVGWRALSQFGGESEDPDTVFVRNRRLETDFEVVRETENQPPAHIRYGMTRDEFDRNKSAGLIRFRPGDS